MVQAMPAPRAAYRQVQDEVKLFVERPSVTAVCGRRESGKKLPINEPLQALLPPLDRVRVPLRDGQRLGVVGLRVVHVIVGSGVNRTPHLTGRAAHSFHDVDLPALRPSPMGLLQGEHPDRRPRSLSVRQPCANLDTVTRTPRCEMLRRYLGRCEVLPSVPFAASRDAQDAVLHPSILAAARIVLQLAVPEPSTSMDEVPL
mmetsp:Transcript_35785/g.94668  ORF Transcript_35785/g.94668 Transcript_35785/m.94668 type:complete len:201 (+) Transcript_35785:238-840(+)